MIMIKDKEVLDDDKIFLKLIEDSGYKIYNATQNSFEEEVLNTLEQIVKVLLGPEVLNINITIKIHLINCTNINASVCKCGDTYYISLFRGVITDLRDFVKSFVIKNFPFDFFQQHFKNIKEDKGTFFEFFNEDDIKHYKLANQIATNILFMIVYHEIGHIFSGHIDSTKANTLYLEVSNNKKDGMISQAKEFMADFFSLNNSLVIYNSLYRNNKEEFIYNHCCYLISLYSLYIYFENNRGQHSNKYETYEKLYERTHPHPAVRLLYMMDLIESELEFELKKLFNVSWLKSDNEKEILSTINCISYIAICEFSLKMESEYRLVNKCYENRSLRIRQLIQNIASDLYDETFQKVAIVKFRGIGRVTDKYVNDILKSNDYLGKYDVEER